MGFVLAVVMLFCIGSCVLTEKCQPDADGKVYSWCNYVLDKEEVKK